VPQAVLRRRQRRGAASAVLLGREGLRKGTADDRRGVPARRSMLKGKKDGVTNGESGGIGGFEENFKLTPAAAHHPASAGRPQGNQTEIGWKGRAGTNLEPKEGGKTRIEQRASVLAKTFAIGGDTRYWSELIDGETGRQEGGGRPGQAEGTVLVRGTPKPWTLYLTGKEIRWASWTSPRGGKRGIGHGQRAGSS